jgi:hypothetical protein
MYDDLLALHERDDGGYGEDGKEMVIFMPKWRSFLSSRWALVHWWKFRASRNLSRDRGPTRRRLSSTAFIDLPTLPP